ncbi:hypothetical protein [Streptomyces purpurogeneiscleroticus]|uniref:hypothetical protein n=1 Tax=Streptomyces purpurogeneiscleroticus TaxID=68259 RepID=UPI001CBFC65C|nr:hypothetical protein [Streptomyces purpurogeneiscleroticus]MBZ4017507.1 hypothetical protein [Streptomyces purpurogeneiscleroticus]
MSRRGARDAHCWPFLVGRGRVVGQRTLLVPRFLGERNLSGLLRDAITGSLTQEGESRHAEAPLPGGGRIGLSYRIVQASPPGADGVVLRDRSGRPIELAYGVVVTGGSGARARMSVADADLPGLRPMVLDVFARFLEAERAFPPAVSARVTVAELAAGTVPVPEPGRAAEPAPAAPDSADDAPAEPGEAAPGPEAAGEPQDGEPQDGELQDGEPQDGENGAEEDAPEDRFGLVGRLVALLRGPGGGLWAVVLLAGWPVAVVLALVLILKD